MLGNLTVTSKTIIEKADDLDSFFSDLQGLAITSTRVLSDNERNLIRVGRVTEPVLKLLAVYSPEFPCLIKGAAKYAPRLAKTFEGNQVKQYIEFGTAQYDAYHRRRPAALRRGRARPLVRRPPEPRGPGRPAGVRGGHGHRRAPADQRRAHLHQRGCPAHHQRLRRHRRREGDLNALLAGQTGRAADSYGSLGSLLYGPVVRGGDGS